MQEPNPEESQQGGVGPLGKEEITIDAGTAIYWDTLYSVTSVQGQYFELLLQGIDFE